MSSIQPPGGSLTAAQSTCQSIPVPSCSTTSPKNCPEKFPEIQKPTNQSPPSSSSSKNFKNSQKSKTRESSKSPGQEETLILTKTEYDRNIEHHPSQGSNDCYVIVHQISIT